MTTEQKRVKIAEAMGFTVIDVPFAPRMVSPDNTYVFTKAAEKQWRLCYPSGKAVVRLLSYFTDANAAITLCDAMAKEGFGWQAMTTRNGIRFAFENCGTDSFRATAATLPIAICEAFARAKGLWT